MSSDTYETAFECAKEAGAIVKCPSCREYDLSAYVDEAEERAYAIARKNGRLRRGMSRQEVRGIIQDVLQDTGSCPRCSNK
jgi:hypothetical protein